MAREKRPREISAHPTVVLRCTACHGFIGYGTDKRAVFCRDFRCHLVRPWTFSNEELSGLVAFLRETKGLLSSEIRQTIKMDLGVISNIYKNRSARKSYTRL